MKVEGAFLNFINNMFSSIFDHKIEIEPENFEN